MSHNRSAITAKIILQELFYPFRLPISLFENKNPRPQPKPGIAGDLGNRNSPQAASNPYNRDDVDNAGSE